MLAGDPRYPADDQSAAAGSWADHRSRAGDLVGRGRRPVGQGAGGGRHPAAAAGAAIALTALFTVGGFGGVIPNGAVLSEAGELLTGAWEQIRTTVSPAPASTELAFLICLSVGATALIVDILIAVCRAPALVALPLLCVYSVPASIDLRCCRGRPSPPRPCCTRCCWRPAVWPVAGIGAGAGFGAGGHRCRARRAGHRHRPGGGRIGDRGRHRGPAAADRAGSSHRNRTLALRLAAGQPGAAPTRWTCCGSSGLDSPQYLRTIGLQNPGPPAYGWFFDEPVRRRLAVRQPTPAADAELITDRLRAAYRDSTCPSTAAPTRHRNRPRLVL